MDPTTYSITHSYNFEVSNKFHESIDQNWQTQIKATNKIFGIPIFGVNDNH